MSEWLASRRLVGSTARVGVTGPCQWGQGTSDPRKGEGWGADDRAGELWGGSARPAVNAHSVGESSMVRGCANMEDPRTDNGGNGKRRCTPMAGHGH